MIFLQNYLTSYQVFLSFSYGIPYHVYIYVLMCADAASDCCTSFWILGVRKTMSNERSQPNSDSSELHPISYHHIKSNYFRVIHADGVWGGVTPALKIQMAFYSERSPIPEVITMAIDDDRLGKEIDRVSKKGVVREIEASVVMDLEVAKSFVDWLNDKITKAEDIKSKANLEVASDEHKSQAT